jgi:hypothetical protein
MAANTVSVSRPFPSTYTGTFLETLIGQVEKAEQKNPDHATARAWYVGMAQEAGYIAMGKAFTCAWYEGMELEAKRFADRA